VVHTVIPTNCYTFSLAGIQIFFTENNNPYIMWIKLLVASSLPLSTHTCTHTHTHAHTHTHTNTHTHTSTHTRPHTHTHTQVSIEITLLMTQPGSWSGEEWGLGVATTWEHCGWMERWRVSVFLFSHCTEGHCTIWASEMSSLVCLPCLVTQARYGLGPIHIHYRRMCGNVYIVYGES